MLLTRRFNFKVNSTQGIILGHLTLAASKLYNIANYERKEYQKLSFEKEPDWYDQKKRLKDNLWYKSLPSQTAQDVLANLEESWKSYRVLKYKFDHGKKLSGEPQSPRYKDKNSHTNITYLQAGFKVIENQIRFMIPKGLSVFLFTKFGITDKYFYIPIKESINGTIKEITFHYITKEEYQVNVVYDTYVKTLKKDNGRHISIDLGINNLATIYDNNGYSFIISGNSFLSTIYRYDKLISYYQEINDKLHQEEIKDGKHVYLTKRIKKLSQQKERKISYILHCLTRQIVDYSISNNITKVIIGDISGIDNKESSLIGKHRKQFNQKLHSLPFSKIYFLLEYKLKQKGIELIKQNESFSSQCSPLSKEVSKEYADKTKRINRGLFKDNNDIYNADSVGAFNILRKYYQEHSITKKLSIKKLSNPDKISISVTSFKEVGVMGRNYPDIVALLKANYSMLGNSIAE